MTEHHICQKSRRKDAFVGRKGEENPQENEHQES